MGFLDWISSRLARRPDLTSAPDAEGKEQKVEEVLHKTRIVAEAGQRSAAEDNVKLKELERKQKASLELLFAEAEVQARMQGEHRDVDSGSRQYDQYT
jgi:uncharacterized protein YaiL (DUF2058 family)